MKNTYKIPKRYYIDHVECDCEAPEIIRETKTHYFISAEENEALAELRSRATHYADDMGGDYYANGCGGIVASARATLKVIGEDADQSAAAWATFNQTY
ncbi:MAG: hypothetical protein CL581_18800 [Alteromonadaceae bacterium]|nr:hypothetical protein [Alteromonadaceae bacterium]